ncbi:hypothetical protein EP12_06795 [Alteromonas australica]|nr:hypothetical protein EP12_06795 [Alteromonas australica]
MVKRYKEVFDPNHSQECICHRGPMTRGLEESPDGDFVDIEDYEELKKLLAKANERVAELESQHQLLTKRIEPLLDMQEDGEHYARCHLADDIYEAFIEGSSVDALNKFAIEKKIKELIEFGGQLGCLDNREANLIANAVNRRIEQLRKEQE